MRQRATLAAFLTLFLVTTSAPVVFAAHIHQFSWGSSAYYPRDQASFHMTLFNDYPGTIFVKEILMQWDWQSGGGYYTAPGGQTLIPIQTVDYVINFTVPPNVSIGSHTWTVYYLDANDRQIFVGQGSFKIHDPEERVYLGLQGGLQANLTQLRNTRFEDPNATALLSLANAVYNNATSLADQQDFFGAVAALKNTSMLLSTTVDSEARYRNLMKAYLSDFSQVTAVLSNARSSNFQSQNATRYLNQAVIVSEQASFLASGMKYARADLLLKNASSLIAEANAAEQVYLGQGQTTSTTSSSSPTQTQQSSETTSSQATSTIFTSTEPSSTTAFIAQQEGSTPVTIAAGAVVGLALLGSIIVVLVRRRG